MNYQDVIDRYTLEINEYLLRATENQPGSVGDAMRYSLLAGGKRIRPALLFLTCDMLSGEHGNAVPAAAALEMIHTYSLIHDDLPCMDDDDFRRGRPSCHKQFGEATALLAGDALLTEAFSQIALIPDLASVRKLTFILADAAGNRGMIHGQEMDLQAEKGQLQLEEINQYKTGKLIVAAVLMGAACAGLEEEKKLDALRTFAEKTGEVFQIVDDILDVTSSAEVLGKTIGSDVKNEKKTYVSLYGIDRSRESAIKKTQEACLVLNCFSNSDALKWYAMQLLVRIK